VEKINWKSLSENRAATELLRKNPDKIRWGSLARHGTVFSRNVPHTYK
jgi:hypothetical protein